MNFDNLIEWAKNITIVLGCGISISTFLGIVIKPIRKRMLRWFIRVTHSEEIKMLDDKITSVEAETKKEISDLTKRLETVEKESSNALASIAEKIDDIASKMFDNEADRLRGELFNYGNRCRREQPLYADEFRYIQTIWKKYDKVLHENSIGEEEYKFISGYFNSAANQEMIKK